MSSRVCALAMLLLTGCAVTRTTESPEHQSPPYQLTADQADHVLAVAMAEEFPGYPITRVDAPNHGHKVDLRFILDYHTIVAYEMPVAGGYQFEVNSYGSMILQGEIRAHKLFKLIEQHAATDSAPGR